MRASRIRPDGGLLFRGGGLLSPGGGLVRVPTPGGVSLIADLDFSAPVVQSFPETAAGLAALLGDAAATPSYIWPNQEASGNLIDSVAAEELTPESSPLQGQGAFGVDDGSGLTGRKAIEFTQGSASSFDGATSLLDSDSTSLAFLIVPRQSAPNLAAGDILGKQESDAGYRFWSNTAGRYDLNVDSGTPVANYTINTGDHDGAWDCLIPHINVTSNEIRVFSSKVSAPAAVSMAALGSITNADPFKLGEMRTTAKAHQNTYTAAFEGAAADALYALGQTAVDSFWKNATDPTALLTTKSRASSISAVIAAGAVGHFSPNTIPIVFDPAFASGFGLLCQNATSNLVPWSAVSTGAANTNVTPADNAADSADGCRCATTLLATAADGNQAKACVTVASTQYTGTAYIEEVSAGVTGRVIMYDESNASELGATAFVGTGTPQRIQVIASTIGGGISTSMRVEIDTDTETVIAWSYQLEAGSGSASIIKTAGAAAATVQSDWRTTEPMVKESTGELEAVFVIKKLPPSGDTHYVFDTVTAADRRALSIDSAGALKLLVNNAAGGLVAEITLGTVAVDTEYTATCQWDEAAGLDSASVRGKVNAVAKVAGGTSFTSGGGFAAELSVGGSAATADTALDGPVQRIRGYDGARSMPV